MEIVAVAGGKGGTGKTTLTANLGAALAENGYRVVLFDADLGLANLDVILGVKSDLTVHHLVEGLAGFEDVAVETPFGLRVVVGGSGVGSLLRLSRKRLERMLERARELETSTDILIFDSASGADARVMTFLAFADTVVLVTTPDPSSILDCYSTAKVLFRRRRDASVNILVNRVRDQAEGTRVFEVLRSAMLNFLRKEPAYLGSVREDRRAAEITRSCGVFVVHDPALPASEDISMIAGTLLQHLSAGQARGVRMAA